jgi:dephospho-CoA kinase
LTGGIASGKSTVAGMFRNLGAAVVDADETARELVRPGQEAWQEIVDAFGRNILDTSDAIDRPKLGQVIFHDAEARRRLEAILHPRIHQAMDTKRWTLVRGARHPVVLMDIPLLFETDQQERFAEVIVVYVPEKIQLARLIQRDRLVPAEAQARLDAQISIEIKRLMATRLIDNSGSRAQTRTQVKKIYQQLKLKGSP